MCQTPFNVSRHHVNLAPNSLWGQLHYHPYFIDRLPDSHLIVNNDTSWFRLQKFIAEMYINSIQSKEGVVKPVLTTVGPGMSRQHCFSVHTPANWWRMCVWLLWRDNWDSLPFLHILFWELSVPLIRACFYLFHPHTHWTINFWRFSRLEDSMRQDQDLSFLGVCVYGGTSWVL